MRRGEGKYILLNMANKACGVLALLLFVTHHPVLGVLAGVGAFALGHLSGKVAEDGLIDEALAAKEEWDRLHPPEDSPEDLPRWKRPRSAGSNPDTAGDSTDQGAPHHGP